MAFWTHDGNYCKCGAYCGDETVCNKCKDKENDRFKCVDDCMECEDYNECMGEAAEVRAADYD